MPKLRIWWIPQIPMVKEFIVEVGSLAEGKKLLDTLAEYDKFQFENNIKPDYSNCGGLHSYEHGEWAEWTNIDGYAIDELTLEQLERADNEFRCGSDCA